MASRRSSQLSYSRVCLFLALWCGFCDSGNEGLFRPVGAIWAFGANWCQNHCHIEGLTIAAAELPAPFRGALVDAEREASVGLPELFGDVDRVLAERRPDSRSVQIPGRADSFRGFVSRLVTL